MLKLKENAFVHISNEQKSAVLFDTFNRKIYSIPLDIAKNLLNDTLTDRDISIINSHLSDLHYSDGIHQYSDSIHSLRFIVTNKCNFNCDYCFAHQGSYGIKPHNMSIEVVKRTIDFFFTRYKQIKAIDFFGGEPLLAFDVIQYACEYTQQNYPERQLSYSIVTNASLLNDEISDFFRKYKVAIVASIDGPKDLNDLHRKYLNNKGSFETVDANIRNFTSGLNLTIEATYTSAHEKVISKNDLYRYISTRYGVSRIMIADATIADKDKEKLGQIEPTIPSNLKQIREFFESEEPIYSDEIVSLIHTFISGNESKYFCGAGYNKFTIDMDGNVYPCHLFIERPDSILFNLMDSQQTPIQLVDKTSYKCSHCMYKVFCRACIIELTKNDELCHINQDCIDYFLHAMLDLYITNRPKFDQLMKGCLNHVTKNKLTK